MKLLVSIIFIFITINSCGFKTNGRTVVYQAGDELNPDNTTEADVLLARTFCEKLEQFEDSIKKYEGKNYYYYLKNQGCEDREKEQGSDTFQITSEKLFNAKYNKINHAPIERVETFSVGNIASLCHALKNDNGTKAFLENIGFNEIRFFEIRTFDKNSLEFLIRDAMKVDGKYLVSNIKIIRFSTQTLAQSVPPSFMISYEESLICKEGALNKTSFFKANMSGI